MSDFKYIGRNIVCEPYVFRSSITASNISASGTISAKRFIGYFDSASVSVSSSYALTASYALNGGSGGASLTTGSTYPITSSWSLYTVTSSYALTALSSAFAYSSSWAATASYFSGSISNAINSDYAISSSYALTASYALNIIAISSSLNAQYFTGDGITTQYVLTKSVSNDYDVLVSFDGLIQKPTYDYTVTGSILNFTTPPPTNIDGEIRYLMTSTSGLLTSGSGANLTTGSTYPITSSWAINTSTSSYLNPLNQIVVLPTVSSSLNFTDDASAAAGGIPLGGLYRNGNFLLIRIT